MKLESIISWSFDTYAAMRDNYASINNNSNVSLTMFGGNMGKFLNSLPKPMLNKINYSLRCRRSASKFQHALYNSNSEADIYLDGWITSMNASEKILTEVIIPITIIKVSGQDVNLFNYCFWERYNYICSINNVMDFTCCTFYLWGIRYD